MAYFNNLSSHTQRAMLVGTFMFISMIALVGPSQAGNATTTAKPDVTPPYTVIKRTPVLRGDDYDNVYACTGDCHSSTADYNATRRELTEEHDRITNYHPKDRQGEDDDYWCQNCHQAGNYNKLKLNSGRNVSFDEAYLLCLQCHGNYKDEFESGIHGRKKGNWDKNLTIHSCPQCHDPHEPKFKPLKPEPAPKPLHGPKKSAAETTGGSL